jgi:L-alanine-DL-glutamate epimerase-like enolase superfamily enzyme
MGFALESLSAQLEQAEEGLLFDSDYSRGREGLPINGLVWMGDRKFERTQAFDLINKGFRCLKFKIGAEYFAHSAPLLREIREFDAGLEMRVDANGAFEAETAYKLMLDLRELGIHSIEQPLRPEAEGEWIDLIRNAPIPVALDESLIGRDPADSFDWLRAMNPHYLILKPTLIGGFKRCDQWIESANRLEMGYWFTSMLESPLGLDAVAQYAAARRNSRPDVAFQGLGTGSIYRGDLPFKSGWSPMVEGAELWRRKAIQ